jgi:hypothetical protein
MWNRTWERTPRGQLFGCLWCCSRSAFFGEYQGKTRWLLKTATQFNQGQPLLSILTIFIGIWVLWRAGA